MQEKIISYKIIGLIHEETILTIVNGLLNGVQNCHNSLSF